MHDNHNPTVILQTRSLNAATAIAATLRGLGFHPKRDFVGGTRLIDGTFVDGSLAQPGPIEWFQERWKRQSRRYFIGIVAQVDPAWQNDDALEAARMALSAIGLALPDGVDTDFEAITVDRAGLRWPRRVRDTSDDRRTLSHGLW